MAQGYRQTLYFKDWPAAQKVAAEDHEDINGASIETLYWRYKAGENTSMQAIIRDLYAGRCDLRIALKQFTELLAYTKSYMSASNEKFIEIVCSAVSNEWKTPDQYDGSEGDYGYGDRNRYLGCVADTFSGIVRDLNANIQTAKRSRVCVEQGVHAWEVGGGDSRRREIYRQQENYTEDAISGYARKADIIRSEITSDNLSVIRALDLIIENWEYLYNDQGAYEAVEYCIVMSASVADNDIVRKQLRSFACDFGR